MGKKTGNWKLATGNSYYRAIREGLAEVNSGTSFRQSVDFIINAIARAMHAGASLLLLNSSGDKLLHETSVGLPAAYLHKGLVDVNKSLGEVADRQPVAVLDVAHDERVQYPGPAVKAGISSILGVPVMVGDTAIGSIRVYAKKPTEFSREDIDFVTAMAGLVAVAFKQDSAARTSATCRPETATEVRSSLLRQYRTTAFAHSSEDEFARILDFYNIEWVYEPRSFILEKEGERVTEMFTPDFYLPALDLYVELTTLKQSLVTQKNRKLRRLRQLYPDIKITLLYKRDFDRLLAKYGVGPLAQARGRGVGRVLFSSAQIEQRVGALAEQISKDYVGKRPILVGVLRGVFCFMADLSRQLTIPLDIDFIAISYYTGEGTSAVRITKDMDLNVAGRHVVMVEDIVDTGMTLSYMLNHIRSREPASLAVCALLDKRVRRIVDVPLKYIGFEVPDEFVVGYGLDYGEKYRNLPFISILQPGQKGEGRA